MKLVYDPPGGPRQEWEFEAGQLTIGESIELEEDLDMTMTDAYVACLNGSVTCMRYFLWLMRRRSEPELTLQNLNNMMVSAISFVRDDEDAGAEGEAPKDAAVTADQSDSHAA